MRGRWGLLLFRALVLTGGALAVWGWYYYQRDPGESFRARKGALVESTSELRGTDSLGERSWLRLRSSSGLDVVAGVLAPVRSRQGRRYPAVVLLGGKATGRYAVDYALDIHDVVILALDYPYEPRPEYSLLTFAADVPAIRNAILEMFPSAMLAVDYLQSRPDVDTTKLVLLGYSFGAPFVPGIATYERRFAAAAMVYGGGELRTLIGHNVRRYEGSLAGGAVGVLAAFLLRPGEPMRFADRIAPIPLIMINGAEDEQVPRENAEKFYAAAGEPKKIIWLESRHVNPRNVELTRTIIGTLKGELERLGILKPPAPGRSAMRRPRQATPLVR